MILPFTDWVSNLNFRRRQIGEVELYLQSQQDLLLHLGPALRHAGRVLLRGSRSESGARPRVRGEGEGAGLGYGLQVGNTCWALVDCVGTLLGNVWNE